MEITKNNISVKIDTPLTQKETIGSLAKKVKEDSLNKLKPAGSAGQKWTKNNTRAVMKNSNSKHQAMIDSDQKMIHKFLKKNEF